MRVRLALLVGIVLLAGSACATATAPPADRATPAGPDSMDSVVRRTFTVYGFRLESGQALPDATLAFETYGRLAPDGRNAILITHGLTSHHHAAGKYAPADRAVGWWNGLIGPGKAIDTNRYYVVSSNMLGSSYGSTGPPSVNPATGKPYGPDFPALTLRDTVTAQRLLLDGLGVRRLVAVVGPSFGGYQAFQWAVTYPNFMRGIVAVVTALRGIDTPEAIAALVRRFSADPNWNGGWHYDRGGIPTTMSALRVETLKRYGFNEVLARAIPAPDRREARLRQMAEAWARQFDPNSLVILRKAGQQFDAERDVHKIRAKVLYVLSRTDKLFPPAIAPGVMARLAAAGVEARYFEIETELGHSASGPEWAKWGPMLRDFLDGLER